eukprot:3462960-Pyramimonas_sp.AAC.1
MGQHNACACALSSFSPCWALRCLVATARFASDPLSKRTSGEFQEMAVFVDACSLGSEPQIGAVTTPC